jgi:hypothetical protein
MCEALSLISSTTKKVREVDGWMGDVNSGRIEVNEYVGVLCTLFSVFLYV